MIVNRVDVEKFKETVEKARKDPSTGKKTMEIEGEWRIGKTGPQFESKIKTEKGKASRFLIFEVDCGKIQFIEVRETKPMRFDRLRACRWN